MDISFVCSLGERCHSSQILKNNNLKICSYPFDWIFSSCDNIIHCLEDDFKTFLDKSYYVSLTNKKCGHSLYNERMFNHHNPLINHTEYNYYIRCVVRFRQLLIQDKHKLFIMIYTNLNNFDETLINNTIDFNNKFSQYTQNYTLLVILHIPNKKYNYYSFTHTNNIDFLELHTLSNSDGVNFINKIDNDFLNTIIKNTYVFNIITH